MKQLVLILSFILLSSCSSVKYDYQPGVDFTEYKSFSFVPNTKSKSLNRQRLEASLIDGLELKGLVFKADAFAADPADLVIKPRYQIVNRERMVTAHGGLYHRSYYAGTDFYFVESQERYLVVEFVDSKKNEVVWQATSYGFNAITFSQEKFNKIVNEMLLHFPPDSLKK
ncbi:DUF4136 domain-containing protein [Lentisphaera marina]|uniref:DUF4136 domain-containing protein n=1 Tax=Lentisphaera marina TaxID=1111041 RepID=UPI00236544F6|nr:DUF4136 domain-containing protein [Lentisphaera marina]MDD7984877.1 DUF4136 domain-containing protein [Lentisphaera marina]